MLSSRLASGYMNLCTIFPVEPSVNRYNARKVKLIPNTANTRMTNGKCIRIEGIKFVKIKIKIESIGVIFEEFNFGVRSYSMRSIAQQATNRQGLSTVS